MALSAYIRKEDLKFNNLSFYIRKVEIEEQTKYSTSRRNWRKITAEINGTENSFIHL